MTPHPTEENRQRLQMMENEIARLTHLVQDILEITNLGSGRAVAAWKPISLPTVIEKAVVRYQDRAETAGLTLVVEPLPSDLPLVEGDQARLAQALGEIVENAVTFVPSGGGMTVEAGAAEDKGRTWVTISVRDTGPGIPPEEQEKVFDRFFRGSLAESDYVRGTGLGLSIAQEIVRAHGGRITLESQVGSGSTFTTWLPPAE